MFLTYAITVDEREVLRLYFKHIQLLWWFLVCLFFQENHPYAVKVNNFGPYSFQISLFKSDCTDYRKERHCFLKKGRS